MSDPAKTTRARELWDAERKTLANLYPSWSMPAWSRAPAWRRRPYLVMTKETAENAE